MIDAKIISQRISIIRAMCDELEAELEYAAKFKREQDLAKKKVDKKDTWDDWWRHMPSNCREPYGKAFFARRARLIREEALAIYKDGMRDGEG